MPLPSPPTDWLHRVRKHQESQDGIFARCRTIGLSEYLDDVEPRLELLSRQPELRVRVYLAVLEAFVATGKWLTLFHHARDPVARGPEYRDRRRLTEQNVLGISADAEPDARPVYGYLRGSDETGPVSGFGTFVMHLKPEVNVFATVCCGDSYGMTDGGADPTTAASALVRPSMECRHAYTDAHGASEVVQLVFHENRYAEVQLHHRLTPDDVAYISYDPREPPSEELVRAFGGERFRRRGPGE